MTKLKLNLAQGAGEILTREELKKIVGGTEGSGSGSGSGSDEVTCTRTDGWYNYSCSGSSSVMGSWAAAWTSLGWGVKCSNGFDNGIRIYVV